MVTRGVRETLPDTPEAQNAPSGNIYDQFDLTIPSPNDPIFDPSLFLATENQGEGENSELPENTQEGEGSGAGEGTADAEGTGSTDAEGETDEEYTGGSSTVA